MHFPYATMESYLECSDIIDWRSDIVFSMAKVLSRNSVEDKEVAKNCFEFVRDEIAHSGDTGTGAVTISASEVMEEMTGFCYAKSHLLAALLRANHIPAGLCYQRLSINGDGPPYCLHGLNSVYLKEYGWYRIDARGNRDCMKAFFTPPVESLPYRVDDHFCVDLNGIFSYPLYQVIKALSDSDTVDEVNNNLPDIFIL